MADTSKARTRDQPPSVDAASPAFDADRYLPMAEGLAIPEEQKEELLRTLFEIMKTFIDLGFDVNAVPYLLPEIFNKDAALNADMVEYIDQTQDKNHNDKED